MKFSQYSTSLVLLLLNIQHYCSGFSTITIQRGGSNDDTTATSSGTSSSTSKSSTTPAPPSYFRRPASSSSLSFQSQRPSTFAFTSSTTPISSASRNHHPRRNLMTPVMSSNSYHSTSFTQQKQQQQQQHLYRRNQVLCNLVSQTTTSTSISSSKSTTASSRSTSSRTSSPNGIISTTTTTSLMSTMEHAATTTSTTTTRTLVSPTNIFELANFCSSMVDLFLVEVGIYIALALNWFPFVPPSSSSSSSQQQQQSQSIDLSRNVNSIEVQKQSKYQHDQKLQQQQLNLSIRKQEHDPSVTVNSINTDDTIEINSKTNNIENPSNEGNTMIGLTTTTMMTKYNGDSGDSGSSSNDDDNSQEGTILQTQMQQNPMNTFAKTSWNATTTTTTTTMTPLDNHEGTTTLMMNGANNNDESILGKRSTEPLLHTILGAAANGGGGGGGGGNGGPNNNNNEQNQTESNNGFHELSEQQQEEVEDPSEVMADMNWHSTMTMEGQIISENSVLNLEEIVATVEEEIQSLDFVSDEFPSLLFTSPILGDVALEEEEEEEVLEMYALEEVGEGEEEDDPTFTGKETLAELMSLVPEGGEQEEGGEMANDVTEMLMVGNDPNLEHVEQIMSEVEGVLAKEAGQVNDDDDYEEEDTITTNEEDPEAELIRSLLTKRVKGNDFDDDEDGTLAMNATSPESRSIISPPELEEEVVNSVLRTQGLSEEERKQMLAEKHEQRQHEVAQILQEAAQKHEEARRQERSAIELAKDLEEQLQIDKERIRRHAAQKEIGASVGLSNAGLYGNEVSSSSRQTAADLVIPSSSASILDNPSVEEDEETIKFGSPARKVGIEVNEMGGKEIMEDDDNLDYNDEPEVEKKVVLLQRKRVSDENEDKIKMGQADMAVKPKVKKSIRELIKKRSIVIPALAIVLGQKIVKVVLTKGIL